LLLQVLLLRSDIAFGSLLANKIPLKPKVLIKLWIYQKYHSVRSTEYNLIKQKNYSIVIQEVIIMADSVLRDKAKQFAKDVVFLCREIKSSHKESVLVNQLLRSATSIGANLHEAQYAQSKNDFISKLEIAQKECYETEYWLELLFETACIEENKYKKTQNECGAIRRMLISSLKTVKSK